MLITRIELTFWVLNVILICLIAALIKFPSAAFLLMPALAALLILSFAYFIRVSTKNGIGLRTIYDVLPGVALCTFWGPIVIFAFQSDLQFGKFGKSLIFTIYFGAFLLILSALKFSFSRSKV